MKQYESSKVTFNLLHQFARANYIKRVGGFSATDSAHSAGLKGDINFAQSTVFFDFRPSQLTATSAHLHNWRATTVHLWLRLPR